MKFSHISGILLLIFSLAFGCGQSEEAPVTTDMQEDFDHSHKHTHGHGFDHEHHHDGDEDEGRRDEMEDIHRQLDELRRAMHELTEHLGRRR